MCMNNTVSSFQSLIKEIKEINNFSFEMNLERNNYKLFEFIPQIILSEFLTLYLIFKTN